MVGFRARSLACVLLMLPGCGRSLESEVAAAIRARFPDGKPRCLSLASAVGVHVQVPPGAALYYPSEGPTSPLRHLFVFWAGPTNEPAAELAVDLATRGILRKVTVQATTDIETVTTSRRPPPDSGLPKPPDAYRHRAGGFAVDIYLAVPDDPEFGFNRELNFAPSLVSYASFPSLLYGEGSLPAPDRHYRVMTIDPYATSHVVSACFPETLAAVGEVRTRIGGLGDEYYEADVTWIGHPRDWMLTRAFRRAALAPDTEPLDARRRSVVVLARKNGQLVLVREGRS